MFPKAIFLKVDFDDTPDIFNYCKVKTTPVILVYKNGRKENEIVGGDRNKLKQILSKFPNI